MDPRYGGALWRGLSICLGHYTLDIPSGTLFHVREGTPGWLRGFGPGRRCFHVRRRRFSSKLGNLYRNPITDISDLENCPSQPLQPTPKKKTSRGARTIPGSAVSLAVGVNYVANALVVYVTPSFMSWSTVGTLRLGFRCWVMMCFFLGWCPEIGGILWCFWVDSPQKR